MREPTVVRVQDLEKLQEADNPDAVGAALAERYGSGVNALWLSHGGDKYPALLILLSGDLASCHYFPSDRHPGYRSVGRVPGLDPGGITTFFMNSIKEPPQPMPNDSVVSCAAAHEAAKQFLSSTDLPTAVEWLEL